MTSMVSYEPYVNDCTQILSQRFDEFAKAGLPVDIGYWMQCYAFDTIGLVTVSHSHPETKEETV